MTNFWTIITQKVINKTLLTNISNITTRFKKHLTVHVQRILNLIKNTKKC